MRLDTCRALSPQVVAAGGMASSGAREPVEDPASKVLITSSVADQFLNTNPVILGCPGSRRPTDVRDAVHLRPMPRPHRRIRRRALHGLATTLQLRRDQATPLEPLVAFGRPSDRRLRSRWQGQGHDLWTEVCLAHSNASLASGAEDRTSGAAPRRSRAGRRAGRRRKRRRSAQPPYRLCWLRLNQFPESSRNKASMP